MIELCSSPELINEEWLVQKKKMRIPESNKKDFGKSQFRMNEDNDLYEISNIEHLKNMNFVNIAKEVQKTKALMTERELFEKQKLLYEESKTGSTAKQLDFKQKEVVGSDKKKIGLTITGWGHTLNGWGLTFKGLGRSLKEMGRVIKGMGRSINGMGCSIKGRGRTL